MASKEKEKKQSERREESFKSEIMHRLKTHPFLFIGTVVVLVIVIVAFVFVPAIVPSAQRGDDRTFGYYNKVPIKNVPGNYFNNILRAYQLPSSDDGSYIFWVRQLYKMAFEETAIHLGVLDEMKQAGYTVPEDVVNREVAKRSEFQNNGRFSPALFRAMDTISRMNLQQQIQDSITKMTYFSDIAGLKTSSKEASFISSMVSLRRSFDAVVFPFSSYPDSEVVSYAAANPGLFRMIHHSGITITTGEREARQILESVQNGTATFEDAARNNSQDMYAERGGDMGLRMAYELSSEISDAEAWEKIVSLPRGALSELVKVPMGWAFYRAEEAVYPADTSDPSQMEKIRSYIMNNLRGRVEDWLIAEAERFSGRIGQIGEGGIDEALLADGTADGIVKHSFGPLPVNYGDSSLFNTIASAGVPELSNAGRNQFFWRAAFTTPLNTPSRPLVIDNNVIVLYPLEETFADESEIQVIEELYTGRMGAGQIDESRESAIRSYFLNNKKLDDRFEDTFWKLVGTSY